MLLIVPSHTCGHQRWQVGPGLGGSKAGQGVNGFRAHASRNGSGICSTRGFCKWIQGPWIFKLLACLRLCRIPPTAPLAWPAGLCFGYGWVRKEPVHGILGCFIFFFPFFSPAPVCDLSPISFPFSADLARPWTLQLIPRAGPYVSVSWKFMAIYSVITAV